MFLPNFLSSNELNLNTVDSNEGKKEKKLLGQHTFVLSDFSLFEGWFTGDSELFVGFIHFTLICYIICGSAIHLFTVHYFIHSNENVVLLY